MRQKKINCNMRPRGMLIRASRGYHMIFLNPKLEKNKKFVEYFHRLCLIFNPNFLQSQITHNINNPISQMPRNSPFLFSNVNTAHEQRRKAGIYENQMREDAR